SDLTNIDTAIANLGINAVKKLARTISATDDSYIQIGTFTSSYATGYINIKLESGSTPGWGPVSASYIMPVNYWRFSGTGWYSILPVSDNELGYNWFGYDLQIQQTATSPKNTYTLRLKNRLSPFSVFYGGSGQFTLGQAMSFNITLDYNPLIFSFSPLTGTGTDLSNPLGFF